MAKAKTNANNSNAKKVSLVKAKKVSLVKKADAKDKIICKIAAAAVEVDTAIDTRKKAGKKLRETTQYKTYSASESEYKSRLKNFLKLIWSQNWSYSEKWAMQAGLLGEKIPLLRLFPYVITNDKGKSTLLFKEGLPDNLNFAFDYNNDAIALARESSLIKPDGLDSFLEKGRIKAREDAQCFELQSCSKEKLKEFFVKALEDKKANTK